MMADETNGATLSLAKATLLIVWRIEKGFLDPAGGLRPHIEPILSQFLAERPGAERSDGNDEIRRLLGFVDKWYSDWDRTYRRGGSPP